MEIKELLTEDYLKRFKIYYPQALFPPDFNLLKDHRCPICGNKLKFPRNKEIAICSGKKHKKKFIIKNKTLIKIVYE